MADQLEINDTGIWLEVHLNRPRAGNLVTPRMMLTLGRLTQYIHHRHKAVVITAKGDDFCLGRESKPVPGATTGTAHAAYTSVMSPILNVYRAMWTSPVPVIAVVHGRAHGFGCGLAGACDMVLASDDAQFALPEMAKGIPPTLVMTALRDVHRKTLLEMVYSCRAIDAASAHAAGLVSRVVPAAQLTDALTSLKACLDGYDTDQIRYIKGFADKPGKLAPDDLAALAGFTLATAMSRRS